MYTLLQTLADELRENNNIEVKRPFLLLFEEPELFLHPALQKQIGNTLEDISQTSHVIISTHSPLLITSNRINGVIIVNQIIDQSTNQSSTKCFLPDILELSRSKEKHLSNLLNYPSSSEFLFSDFVLVVEGISDKLLLNTCWELIQNEIKLENNSISYALIDAGSKDIIPFWLKYLKALNIKSKGLVDIDFLWNGAGKLLSSDQDLSKFCNDLKNAAKVMGFIKNEDGKEKIEKNKANEFIKVNLKEKVETLHEKIKKNHSIWVLKNGEIENYFNLTKNSKGEYLTICHKLRLSEVKILDELKDLLLWAFNN